VLGVAGPDADDEDLPHVPESALRARGRNDRAGQ
jgi:hypothetical protein